MVQSPRGMAAQGGVGVIGSWSSPSGYREEECIIVISLLALTGSPVVAGTSAQVEYGTVQESRLLTQEAPRREPRPSHHRAAALGAAVGSRFGGGSRPDPRHHSGGRRGGQGLPPPPG